jgi:hypothetical protein
MCGAVWLAWSVARFVVSTFDVRSLRRPFCVWVLLLPRCYLPLYAKHLNLLLRCLHPTRRPKTTAGNDNCGFSGGHDAIHWHEPKYLQKTTDVLVALARNLTATNATEAYAGGYGRAHARFRL